MSSDLDLLPSSFRNELRPGDALLYRPSGVFGWIIALKTWTRISHVEVYAGDGQSVASRDGIGVGKYPLRLDQLARVLRPRGLFFPERAMEWFGKVDGQKYDYTGLLVFALARRKGAPDKQWCSEFATRFYNAGGFFPFAPRYSPDRIAPAQFLQSAEFREVWSDEKLALQPPKFGTPPRIG